MEVTIPGTESYRERKVARTIVPGSGKGRVISLQGAKWPESERAWERKGQGANWPGSYWPIHSRERIGPGAKRLGTNMGDSCKMFSCGL